MHSIHNQPVPLNHCAVLLVSVILMLVLPSSAHAETLKLFTGQIVVGEIVEHNQDTVIIDAGVGITMTFFLDEIDQIDGQHAPLFLSKKDQPKGPVEKDQDMDIVEPVEIQVPVKILEAVEPVDGAVKPGKEQPLMRETEPIKDIRIIEEQGRSKETASPFGPTVKENETPPQADAKDIGKNATLYLLDRAFEQKQGDAESKPPAVSDDVNPNVLIRLFDHFVEKCKVQYDEYKLLAKDYADYLKEKIAAVPEQTKRDVLLFGSLALGVLYILTCIPMMKIAKTLKREHIWLVWIPGIQVFYFVYMADRSIMWSILLLVPFVNLFVVMGLFASILTELNKTTWKAVLIIIPVINTVMLWIIAFRRTKPKKIKSAT